MVSSRHRHVPRAPLPAQGVTSCSVEFNSTSERVTPPSSLLRAHAPNQNPLTVSVLLLINESLQVITSPCWKLVLPDPAAAGQSLRRRLDPYPAVSLWCACSLLPRGQRPHIQRHTFGTLKIAPTMQLQQGKYSRGCSHSLMFRLPRSLAPQVAPTAKALSL
jgi:hypothetical protein